MKKKNILVLGGAGFIGGNLVAEISKKMIDDVKVILAEYRLALKIYNSDRKK